MRQQPQPLLPIGLCARIHVLFGEIAPVRVQAVPSQSCHSAVVTPRASASSASPSSSVYELSFVNPCTCSGFVEVEETCYASQRLNIFVPFSFEFRRCSKWIAHVAIARNATMRRRDRPRSIDAPMAVWTSSHSASPIPRSRRNSVCRAGRHGPPQTPSNASRCPGPMTRQDCLTKSTPLRRASSVSTPSEAK